MADIVRKRVSEESTDPRRESPIEVIERDNNNTTDPAANQTNREYLSAMPPAEPKPEESSLETVVTPKGVTVRIPNT